MTRERNRTVVSRRAFLAASGAAAGLASVDSAAATPTESLGSEPCPGASVRPAMEACRGVGTEGCADDHPATETIRDAVEATLTDEYPTVGALIDDGFLPYFDFLASHGPGGWSHWLSPEYIGDDSVLDPGRPESVLVDNRLWRPLGVMFVATRNGNPVERPPAVYGEGTDECAPWHYHVGLPGRFAWWKYRTVYADATGSDGRDGSLEDAPDDDVDSASLGMPCRTPCMLHVWIDPHPESTYAHGAPPRENRSGPPAEAPGFDTDADPGEDELSWDALPADLVDGLAPGVDVSDLVSTE